MSEEKPPFDKTKAAVVLGAAGALLYAASSFLGGAPAPDCGDVAPVEVISIEVKAPEPVPDPNEADKDEHVE